MLWKREKELTPEEVRKLPPEVEVHLNGHNRHGSPTYIEGHVVQSGKSKAFVYDTYYGLEKKRITAYKGKTWTIEGAKE